MIQYLIHIALISHALWGFSQSTSELIEYDFVTKEFDTLLISFDPSLTSGKSQSSFGNLSGRFDLILETPTSNTYENSQFGRLLRAADLFEISDYPARTIVKFGTCNPTSDRTTSNRCTGTLVGSKYVLTAAHCVSHYDVTPYVPIDRTVTISVAPNNGDCHPNIESTIAIKAYFLPEWLGESPSFSEDDIVLLELKDHIGLDAGWMGFGFNESCEFYTENVFQKFSIPGTWLDVGEPYQSEFNPELFYNGDTLYYNYGNLNCCESNYIGHNGYLTDGASGQSGSGLFVTNNSDDYTVYGVQTFSNCYTHPKLSKEVFFGFKSIVERPILSVNEKEKPTFAVFPNPFKNSIQIHGNFADSINVVVYSMNGNVIYERSSIENNTIDLSQLEVGVYILTINIGQESFNRKIARID